MSGRIVLDCILHKLPSSRKYYRVTLIVPDNGIPIIEYNHASNSKRPKKTIQFEDLLFADKKHDIANEKFAFSIYTTDKTTTFLAKDETMMNEWLTKIRECHSNLYPEFKRYDYVFEANLLDNGLARTMNIQGHYRVALCKESLDLIPLLPASDLLTTTTSTTSTTTSTLTTTAAISAAINKLSSSTHHQHHHHPHHHHHHHPTSKLQQATIFETTTATKLPNEVTTVNQVNHSNFPHHATNPFPQPLPSHQRFHKRHPNVSSKTIELVLRSIRRCGHTDCNFYIESGRHSQIGEGDLWMSLSKKATARQLHELLLAAMKNASSSEDQFLYKAPRSRSGSSSDAHRSQRSRSSSLVCLVADTLPHITANAPATSTTNNNIDEDSGYLPMA